MKSVGEVLTLGQAQILHEHGWRLVFADARLVEYEKEMHYDVAEISKLLPDYAPVG